MIKGPTVYVTKTSRSKGLAQNGQIRLGSVRPREYLPRLTYSPEFVQTLSEGGAKRNETIKGLCWLKQKVGLEGEMTHIAQIVNKPHEIIALEACPGLQVLVPVQYVAELIMKLRQGPIIVIELLQSKGTEKNRGNPLAGGNRRMNGYALICSEGLSKQLLPGGDFAVYPKVTKVNNVRE